MQITNFTNKQATQQLTHLNHFIIVEEERH